jgi:sugar O-acyltransferase (sialic acid O-acetyltransferase NeuD family)
VKKTNYVIIGYSHLLGDLIDCIEVSGGVLRAVVLNVPETPYPGRPTLAERLARLQNPVDVGQLEKVQLDGQDEHLIGFSGAQMQPLLNQLREKYPTMSFDPLVHKTAILQRGVRLGAGAILNAGAIVGSWAQIGNHTILNRGSSVGHDCRISSYCFLSPAAALASHVTLGVNVKVGTNATILPDVSVGDNAVIGAGAVVLEDVRAGATVVGNPARELHRPK